MFVPPVLSLLPRAVAVETDTACRSTGGRAGLVTWTNTNAAGGTLTLRDCPIDSNSVFQPEECRSSKDAVVSFNRRGLSRLPPDFSTLCSSLVIFSCAGNSLHRLDFGAKSVPHLRQLDCRLACCDSSYAANAQVASSRLMTRVYYSCNLLTELSFCHALPSLLILTCDENPITDASGVAASSRLLSLSLNKCATEIPSSSLFFFACL
jgi:hypothetical protein